MRILIASSQYPGYGGGATNSYSLIKKMREEKIKCAGMFLDDKNNIDPEKIGGIFSSSQKKEIIKYLGGYPTHVFGKNYKAPYVGYGRFPKAINIYLVSGCPQMMSVAKKHMSAVEYIESNRRLRFPEEERAIKRANFVIPNSLIGKRLLEFHYGKLKKIKNPINTSNIVKDLPIISWEKKEYDICFCSSHFNRPVKNTVFAKKMLTHPYLQKFKIAVIGKGSSAFIAGKNIKNFDLIPHLKAKKIIGKSKVVLNTSFYDASPNVIREAIQMGSNVLVSNNCGWSEKYPKKMVISNYRSISEWLKKISYLTAKRIKNNYSDSFKSQDLFNVLR